MLSAAEFYSPQWYSSPTILPISSKTNLIYQQQSFSKKKLLILGTTLYPSEDLTLLKKIILLSSTGLGHCFSRSVLSARTSSLPLQAKTIALLAH